MIGYFFAGAATMIIGVIVGAAINEHDKKNDHVGDGTTYNQETLTKVYLALLDNGLLQSQANDIINSMQNAGILFRERKN